ncbi:MAG TPA: PQQ-binding-like beta-propeller repeat protein, partial [Alphaproteobacteria bacterium]|nr:PQQ-binding-like beta-propeller repeat protein [Alphaproteobacteria bacterium]
MRLGSSMALAMMASSALAGPSNRDWAAVGGDLSNSHYSTLTRIGPGNVKSLGGAWQHKFESERSRATPVVADGKMFVTAGSHAYALDPKTGATLWAHEFSSPPFGLFRGVAVGGGLVYVGLADSSLAALDESSGKEVWSQLLGDEKPPNVPQMGNQWVTGAPAYANGVVVAGVSGGRAPSERNDGRILGVDAKTGKILWRFHVVPAPGEKGHETWPRDNDVWKKGGGAVWVTPAVDPALGLVYLGTGNAIPELGGEVRAGDNLYTAAVVALDIKTGKLRWHYQTTHHDIFEQDLGTPLVLYDGDVGGKRVKGLAAMRTDGYLFLLDRRTGKPIIPIEERPVPQDAKLKTAPTQPFPVGADEVGPNCVPKDMVPAGFVPGCYF